MYELAADFLVGRPECCWGCATDLSAVVARHLATCPRAGFAVFVRSALRMPGEGSRDRRQRATQQWRLADEALARADDVLRELDERRRRRRTEPPWSA
jgi:hypothetical protein